MEINKSSGCITLIITGLIGGWVLQYDLNHWIPILHKIAPDVFHARDPITSIFPWLFIIGFFIGGPATAVAIVTFLLSVFGVI